MLAERPCGIHGTLEHARSPFSSASQVDPNNESTAVGHVEAALRDMVDIGSPSWVAATFVGHAAHETGCVAFTP